MKDDRIAQSATGESAAQRFVDETWPLDPLGEPRVRRWRFAGRTTLLLLLTFSVLQYYFYDVYLTILTMRRVTLPGAFTDALLKVAV